MKRTLTRSYTRAIFVVLVLGVALACQTITGVPNRPATQAPLVEATPERRATLPVRGSEATVESIPGALVTPTSAETQGIPPTDAPLAPSNLEPLLSSADIDPALLSQMVHYTITVQIQFEDHAFQGHQLVEYTNSETTALDELYLRLLPNGGAAFGRGAVAVSNLTVNGEPVDPVLTVNDTAVEVPLTQPIHPGEVAFLEMDFSGQAPRDFAGGYGIYNYTNEVLSLASWYPQLAVYDHNGWNLDEPSAIGDSVYADMALFTVQVQVDRAVTLAATGSAFEYNQTEGQTQVSYVSGPAREFYLIMSPDFEVVSETVEGTTIHSYHYPSHAQSGEDALQTAVDSLRIFNQRFGKYPYAELDVVQAPMRTAAGVEFPGIVLILDDLYDRGRGNDFFPIVIIHEVAHQWWYNLVGNDIFENPWMDEALATYSEAIYFEDLIGQRGYQQLIGSFEEGYRFTVSSGRDDLVTAPLEHFEQPGSGDYGQVVYTKGALFFHQVREAIGDEAFFEAMQAYFSTYRFQIAEPEDLLTIFETTSGQELDDLYQEWLYSSAR